MSKTITLQTTLELHICPSCGVEWATSERFLDARREDHRSFYCPNGHGLSFPQQNDLDKALSEIEKYKKLYQQEQRYAAGVLGERNAAQRSLSATKGVLTRTKTRIANGVCPCCNRSFANLHTHMQAKHPDYTTEETTE
jgi:hypothetical protein